MVVGIIIITYLLYPERLFSSIVNSKFDLNWYIFFHGRDAGLMERLADFSKSVDGRYFPYAINRGLAKSWNEGLRYSSNDGNRITLILNDDLHFYEGAFDEFVDFVITEEKRVPDYGLAGPHGLETGTDQSPGSDKHFGQSVWQIGSCFAVGPGAIQRVGCFDENFAPSYLEDTDYLRRLDLMGVPLLEDSRTLVEHNRSFTTRTDPALRAQFDDVFGRNMRYYIRKWGGVPGEETFSFPFDNGGFGCHIPLEKVGAPYGPGYDRTDIAI